ncbi:TPA: hypothetical protein DCL37_05570 [Candidatus Acetothermia bacterium]|nr:hypothetical protein [Candidatus Acetothermia bacterium]
MVEFTKIEPTFREEEVLRYLGYGGRPPRMVEGRLGALVGVARGLLRPRAVWGVYGRAELGGKELAVLPEPIRGVELFALALCTVGDRVDDEIRALASEGKGAEALIMDALATAAVSELAEKVAKKIRGWAQGRGYSSSRAFEPGVGGFPLAGQRLIFDRLPAGELGVSLTGDLMMRPRKSLSFLIGIGKDIAEAPGPFSCAGCRKGACPFRR